LNIGEPLLVRSYLADASGVSVEGLTVGAGRGGLRAARKPLRALSSLVLLPFGAVIPPVMERAHRWEVHFLEDPDFVFCNRQCNHGIFRTSLRLVSVPINMRCRTM
jgi:hypothetical protein